MNVKMKKNSGTLFPASYNPSRRRFLGQSVSLGAASLLPLSSGVSGAVLPQRMSSLLVDPIGFNGERKDPVTGNYHLGNGYRMYNPRLMRFHAADSMSPFGRGGINSYAYGLGDPVNRSDPSGHFAIFSLLIGAIVGAVVGAGISAAAEGIRAATTGDSFDWKQIGIGAALGFISGGFGAAAQGAKTGVQFGLALGDAVVSGAADYGLNIAAGASAKQAGINAGIGAAVGLVTFGIGGGVSKARGSKRPREITIWGGTQGDRMVDLKKHGKGDLSHLYFFKDKYKGESRITVNAHGFKKRGAAEIGLTNRAFSANKIDGMLRESFSDYDSINHIRIVACRSANVKVDGVETVSFIQQLSNISGKAVKGYKGKVITFKPDFDRVNRHSLFQIDKHSGPKIHSKTGKKFDYKFRPVTVSPQW